MHRGRHLAPKTRAGRVTWLSLGLALGLFLAMSIPAGANDSTGPNKVWLCHFDDGHAPATPYSYDGNGDAPGFWTTPEGDYLTGDYVVKYNAQQTAGLPTGLNSGQWNLCVNRMGGEFLLVSTNALGSDLDMRGHRAQNLARVATYPDGWKG